MQVIRILSRICENHYVLRFLENPSILYIFINYIHMYKQYIYNTSLQSQQHIFYIFMDKI